MTQLIDRDVDELTPEELAELLNELQYRAQVAEDLTDEELRKSVEVLTRVRQITSASAQKRTGKTMAGPPPSLEDF